MLSFHAMRCEHGGELGFDCLLAFLNIMTSPLPCVHLRQMICLRLLGRLFGDLLRL
jgi:hypothetical protein